MSEGTVAVPANSQTAGSDSSPRILIIDDESAIRESLETLLSMEGYAVDTAENGELGLERIAEQPVDLVLLDLALPGRNGIEILGTLRERELPLPVIMITAFGTVDNVVDAIRAGAQNFVQKPWDNEKLLADIRSSILNHQAEEEYVKRHDAVK